MAGFLRKWFTNPYFLYLGSKVLYRKAEQLSSLGGHGGRRQETGVRRTKDEDRGRRTDDGGLREDVGGLRLEVGGVKVEVRSQGA